MIAAVRRLAVAGLVIACATGLNPIAADASRAVAARLGVPAARGSGAPNPLADPTANVSPSSAFFDACYGMTTSKTDNKMCDSAALKDFDAVRAAEGLGPMTLPGDFASLSVPAQLLAISDIERVDRGLPAVTGLSSSLDGLAQQGANTDDDPPWPSPFPGNEGTGNWAGAGNSALLDDFFWMYDDGLGSGNLDCTQGDQSGCWGHRHDILWAFHPPILMGAAVAYGTSDGTSMAEEFIGGDSTGSADVAPTWASIASTLPVTLSASSVTLVADTGKRAHATVTVTAAAKTHISATVSAGAGSWSVRPGSCTFAAAGSCVLHVTFDPVSSGRHNGRLRVSGPQRDQAVALLGSQPRPRLAVSASRTHIGRGTPATITGTVTLRLADTPVAGQRVELQHRRGLGSWHDVATLTSGRRGLVRFRLHPALTHIYRLKALAADRALEALSAHVRIVVGALLD